jgi:acyl-coenzyme A thioesterase PaaI-like protein
MTVYLNTRYKAPTKASQFLVVKTRCVKAEGRKAFVEGHIEDLDGKRLVECDALYVEPRVRSAISVSGFG